MLARLLEHPKFQSFSITALARSPEKAGILNSLGVKTIIGSYSDLDTVTKLASEADVVFACVSRNKMALLLPTHASSALGRFRQCRSYTSRYCWFEETLRVVRDPSHSNPHGQCLSTPAQCHKIQSFISSLEPVRRSSLLGWYQFQLYAACLMDNALGMHSNHTVYSDADADQIETLSPTAFHRNVDIIILAADKEGRQSRLQ